VKNAVIRSVHKIMSAIEIRSSFDTKYFCLSVFFIITDIVSSKNPLLQLHRTVKHNTLESVEIIMEITEKICAVHHNIIMLFRVCPSICLFRHAGLDPASRACLKEWILESSLRESRFDRLKDLPAGRQAAGMTEKLSYYTDTTEGDKLRNNEISVN